MPERRAVDVDRTAVRAAAEPNRLSTLELGDTNMRSLVRSRFGREGSRSGKAHDAGTARDRSRDPSDGHGRAPAKPGGGRTTMTPLHTKAFVRRAGKLLATASVAGAAMAFAHA